MLSTRLIVMYIDGLLHHDRSLGTVARYRVLIATGHSIGTVLAPHRPVLQLNADSSVRIHHIRLLHFALLFV